MRQGDLSAQVKFWDRLIVRYAVSVIAVAVAFLLRLALSGSLDSGAPYVTFFPAVMIAAIFAGFGPGLMATCLSFLLADLWILPPTGHFAIKNTADILGLIIFLITGLFMSGMAEVYRRSRQKIAEYEKELIQRESEDQLCLAVESNDLGTWDFNPITGKLDGSDRCKEIFGLAPNADLNYDIFLSLLHLDDRQHVHEVVQTALDPQGNGNYEMECRVQWQDGTIRWIAAKGKVFFGDVDGEHQAVRLIGTVLDITERRQTEEDLREHSRLLDLAHVLIRDPEDRIITWNTGAEVLYGFSKEDAIGQVSHDLLQTVFPISKDAMIEAVATTGHWQGELVHTAKDGRKVVVASHQVLYRDEKGNPVATIEVNNDITEQKKAQQERDSTIEFLRLVNESNGIKDLIQAATTFFQKESGCEAVGVRLKDGDDYPYYEARGFPEEFLLLENSLCSRDACGDIIRDCAGYPIIECMCGNVICGRFDPTKPFFSTCGSFWTNNTTELLASTSDADRQARTRNRCNGEGYESVALIPLQVGEQRLGLLQFNDRRVGVFSSEIIALWERFADYLAVALAKFRAEDALRGLEAHKREFYRRTILAATDGKLVIAEKDEINDMECKLIRAWDIHNLADLGEMRDEMTHLLSEQGMEEAQVYNFMGCIIESAGNAVKHAQGGSAHLYGVDDSLIFTIADSGPGIGALALPDVALTRGYSTAGTLGMGYKLILNFADKVYLATDPGGTTVAIEMKIGSRDEVSAFSL